MRLWGDANWSLPLAYHKLMGYPDPAATEMIVSEFGCDVFLPDFEHPARLTQIFLLKGTAVQHSLPKKSLKTIDVVGWFRNRQAKDIMYQLYHVNVPTAPAPFPTDYITQRRDYVIVETPEGLQYKVRFAATPSELKPVRGQLGRLLYPVTMRFFYVDEEFDTFL